MSHGLPPILRLVIPYLLFAFDGLQMATVDFADRTVESRNRGIMGQWAAGASSIPRVPSFHDSTARQV
jgi:hypothetical protein